MVKRRFIIITIISATVLILQAANDQASDQAAIEKAVVEAYHRINASGTDVDRFFADILDFNNGMIIQNGTLFKTRQEAYDTVKKGFEGVAKVQRDCDQTYVKVLSPRHVLLTGTGVTKISLENGQSFNSPFAVSLVFQLDHGQWKLLQGHYSVPM